MSILKSTSDKYTEAKPELTPEQQLKELKSELAVIIFASIVGVIAFLACLVIAVSYTVVIGRAHDHHQPLHGTTEWMASTLAVGFLVGMMRHCFRDCATTFAKLAKLLANNPDLTVEEEPKK